MYQDAKELCAALCIAQKDGKEHEENLILGVGQKVFPSGIPKMGTARPKCSFFNR
jgi:hypothetical protein